MHRLTRIHVLSLAKFMAVTTALVMLVVCVIYAVVILAFGAAMAASGGKDALPMAGAGLVGALAVVVLGPVIYGCITFVFGLLYGVAINFGLRLVGGVTFEME